MDLKTVDELLTTTRSVRKRLDLERPVEREIIEECIELALQAPTGSNMQTWHFLVITDAEKRAKIAEYYRSIYSRYSSASPIGTPGQIAVEGQIERVKSSSDYLAEIMHKVPVLIIPCIFGRVENEMQAKQAGLYGSIFPAIWSLMLALRSRGIGSSLTTLHLRYEKEVAELLGIPETFTQAAMIPVAYFTGDSFKPAKRLPAKEVSSWNSWGNQKD